MTAKKNLVATLAAALALSAALPAAAAVCDKPVQVAAVANAKVGKHPEMMKARKHLETAREALMKAAHDYHGHRAAALKLVDQAIKEIDDGIAAEEK